MYANVVVLTYQSPDIDSYTYEIPKNVEAEIKVGQLVTVPFGNRNPTGLILNTENILPDTKIQIKPISSIILNKPILLSHQIKLLKWLAAYYHAPMVNCLQTMLPPIPKEISSFHFAKANETFPVSSFQFDKQTLVLVPSINQIPETLAKYPKAKNYVVYHNELKTFEKFAAWQKISSGNVDYIFGSRLSVFVPSPNLSQIIIHDEHDGAYKDERSPYFDALTVAEKLKQLTGCKIKIVDDSPKITTYFNHPNDIQIPKIPTKVEIVSMLSEKASGNKSPISDILANYLKLGYQKKKKILLFLNKKSDSGHVYCKNCKYSEFANTQPEICPECKSPNIFFNSLNINSLASLVKKIIPDAEINILSENRLQSTVYSLPTIDIATSAVFYKLMPKKYDLVAHIRADSILNINDFTSQERLFWQIVDLKKLARGLLLLQTYNPEHFVIKAAAQNNYREFFQKHLEERKMLSYPPFSLLVKLSLKGKKEEALDQKSQQLFEDLNKFLVSSFKFPVTVLGPYKSFFTKSNIKYNIILKVKTDDYTLATREKTLKNLEPIFERIPKDVQITVEPSNLN
ncbi:MAG: hypothetical protein Q8P25_01600 [Candidatus Curtissbacteria bacterium]|nr:hypothetical protein [Candidatus Curtissbacteria bacterium]